MMHAQRPVSNRRQCVGGRPGVAMILVLLAVAVAMIASLSFLTGQATSIGIARNIDRHAIAVSIAETALRLTIAEIEGNPNWRSEHGHGIWVQNQAFTNDDVTIPGGNFTIMVEDGTDLDGDGEVDGNPGQFHDSSRPVTLTAIGRYDGVSHRIRAVIVPQGGGMQPGLLAEGFVSAVALNQLSDVNWNAVPDHVEIVQQINRPLENSTVPGWPGGPVEYFGMRYTGKIHVAQSGLWTFYTESDDGSDLRINGDLVVNNDGKHAMTRRSGSVNLTAGLHDIEVRWFEWRIDQGLIVSWQGPGVPTRTVIPAGAFSTMGTGRGGGPSIAAHLGVSNQIEILGRAEVDGFNSTNGRYGGSNVILDGAVLATASTAGGKIKIASRAKVSGSVMAGVGSTAASVIQVLDQAVVSGTLGALTQPLTAPTMDEPTGMPASSGNLSITGNSVVEINGNRRYNNVTLGGNARLRITADATVLLDGSLQMSGNSRIELVGDSTLRMYVTGDFTAGGNGLVNWDSGIPTRMKLYMRGNNREVLIQDNAKVAADVQNPSGRMKVVSNGTEFHGTYYGRDFLADDRAKIRLDVRFGQGGSQETGGTFTYRVIWQDEL